MLHVDTALSGVASPPGLALLPDVLADERDRQVLCDWIDAQPWDTGLRRRVQQYGWRYDYSARRVTASDRLGPLPPPITAVADLAAASIQQATGQTVRFDQAIVNEYLPGQGIAAHVDCIPCYGPVIASLSLGSGCLMRLAHRESGAVRDIWLPVGSLLVLTGPARTEWTHAIAARKSDRVAGRVLPRARRISVTLRSVRL
jgi:alkylated DNA repair dioxygenase AlkB